MSRPSTKKVSGRPGRAILSSQMPALAYQLARHGDLLTTRPFGEEVAQCVCAELQRTEVLLLSFVGVEVASLPFVDALLGRLQAALADEPRRMLAVCGYNTSVKETLVVSLGHRGMALATLHAKRQRLGLLGGSAEMRDALRAAQDLGTDFSVAELAERLHLQEGQLELLVETLLRGGALGAERRVAATPDDRLHSPRAQLLAPLVAS